MPSARRPLDAEDMQQPSRTSVPWVFHLVLATLFVAWIAGTPHGITWSEGWWWPWTGVDGFVLFVVGVICFAVAPVAALLQVAAVVHGVRWLARLLAACYLVPVGFIASFPVTFRLAGDSRPTDADSLAMFVQAYLLFVAVELAFALLLVRPVRRTVPVTRPGGNVADTRFAAFHRSLYGRSAGR
jgi:hypothetical protein